MTHRLVFPAALGFLSTVALTATTGCGVVEAPGSSARTLETELPCQTPGSACGPCDLAPETCAPCYMPGTLPFHLERLREDGSFAYDPPGALIDAVRGWIDPDTGRFQWMEVFRSGHRRVTRGVVGESESDGDSLVVAYDAVTKMASGDALRARVVESWTGCAVGRAILEPDGGVVPRYHAGEMSEMRYTYREQRPTRYRTPDGTRPRALAEGMIELESGTGEEQLAVEGNAGHYAESRVFDWHGRDELSWSRRLHDAEHRGDDVMTIDGTLGRVLTGSFGAGTSLASVADVELVMSPAGEGVGHAYYTALAGGGAVSQCELELGSGACRQRCGDGSDQACPAWILE